MKKYLLITLLLSLVLNSLAWAETTVIKTYILAGQANAKGYGHAISYFPINDPDAPIPNQGLNDIARGVLFNQSFDSYIYDGERETGLGSWRNLQVVSNIFDTSTERFGPELSFGYKVQSELNEKVAIIKYSSDEAAFNNDSFDSGYERLISTISNAKISAASRGWWLDIQGVLWMAGEADASDNLAAATYQAGLTTFIAKLRQDLGQPALKFHIAEIADSEQFPARQQIWNAQAMVAATDDNTRLVVSRDFTLFQNDGLGSENVHFSTEGTVMLGDGFARSVLASVETPEVPGFPGVDYSSHTVSDNSIMIDANLDDWDAVESFGYDGATLEGDGIKADFVEGWVAHDNNNLYVAYKNNGDIDTAKWWPWQVYFDINHSKFDGYAVDKGFTAEYMLQGQGIYKYTGSGNDWSWQYIVSVDNAVNGSIAEFKIPRIAISNPETLKVIFKTRNAAFTGSSSETGVDIYPKPVESVALHNGLLNGQSVIWGELGGELKMTLSEAAEAGVTKLFTTEVYSLFDNQLITYRSTNGEYYTAQVDSLEGNTITLKKPLDAPISQGQNLWNFYGDDSHPNSFGFKSIADFAIREVGIQKLSTGKHVLLGDSWFGEPSHSFEARLAERLSNALIVNKGVGGNTSEDMLNRFDRDVATENPDVVWVIAGINDATSDVSVADYQVNIQAIIAKIRLLGAIPVIIDSQVAQLFFGSDYRTQRTHSYSEALLASDSAAHYKLTKSVSPPIEEAISNVKSIVIDGDLTDWDGLQSFGQDADDINEPDAKADFLEAWMAHDDQSFYLAYKNDGNISMTGWWSWQVYLDLANDSGSGYQVGNGIGADYLIQGGNLYRYFGTGYDWAWQRIEAAEHKVNGDVAEFKFSKQAVSYPISFGVILKARNGFFTNNYMPSGVDSFPDLGAGHFKYSFIDAIPEISTPELPQ